MRIENINVRIVTQKVNFLPSLDHVDSSRKMRRAARVLRSPRGLIFRGAFRYKSEWLTESPSHCGKIHVHVIVPNCTDHDEAFTSSAHFGGFRNSRLFLY